LRLPIKTLKSVSFPSCQKRMSNRCRWFEGQLDLDPLKLVFVDETAATTNMARRYGRRRRGHRLRCGVPHGALQSDHLRLRHA
jgi:hypothetical protein